MNRPEDFSEENSTQEESKQGSEQSTAFEGNDNMSDPAGNKQTEGFPPIKEPQWYGISYTGETPSVYRMAGGAPVNSGSPKKRSRPALVAAVVAACLVLALVAGLAGAVLSRALQTPDVSPEGAQENTLLVSSGSSSESGTVYASDGAKDYDYESVQLEKNDGTALEDSQNGSAGDTPLTLLQAVAKVQDSVVEITATQTSVRGTVSEGAGSGVIIHKDGIIVTNNHVVSGSDNIYVIVTDHTKTDENGNYLQYKYKAYVRGTDEDGDIAVLKIDPKEDLTVASLGSSEHIAVAEEVFAIGNPLGELGGTVTNGIISAISREIQVDDVTMTLLQTNAAINSGNSGGGLFNLAGELIGIVNAKYSATGVEGLGFAIPIDTAVESICSLLEFGYIRGIPAIGVTLSNGSYGNNRSSVPVVYVYDAGEHAQLKKEDIIIKVDGTSVSYVSEVKKIVRTHAVGDTLTLTIQRDGKTMTVVIELVEYKPT